MNNQLTVVDFQKQLKEYERTCFDGALPKHINPASFARCARSYISSNPGLLRCDPKTLWSSILTIAQLGLLPEGFLGQAYIIPYGNKAQFIPGYRGYMELAWRSGKIMSFTAHAVFKGDVFECSYGLDETLRHIPKNFDHNPDDLIKAYSIVKFKGVGHVIKVLDRKEIDPIRDKALSNKENRDRSPWATHYIEMAEKTAVRRIAKFIPMSPDLQKAVAIEDSYENGDWIKQEDGMEIQLPSDSTEELNERFGKNQNGNGESQIKQFYDLVNSNADVFLDTFKAAKVSNITDKASISDAVEDYMTKTKKSISEAIKNLQENPKAFSKIMVESLLKGE